VTRAARWIIGLLLGLSGVAAALYAAFVWLVPDDRTLALRIAAAAQEKYGVRLTVGNAHLTLWPEPELILENIATSQQRPIVVRHVVAHLRRSELLRRRVSIKSIEVDGAVLPQLSLPQLRPQPADGHSEPITLQQLRFRNLTWITRYDRQLPFEGSATFDTDSGLRSIELIRTGVEPPLRITLTRDDIERWSVRSQLGTGTADGQVTLRRGEDGKLRLTGQLAPRNIDVASALDAFKAHSPVRGKASGQTQLSASGDNLLALAASLQTRTTFSMSSATLLHIDIDKAIRSFGKERAGQTALRSLTGRMDTQNTADGIVVRYSNLQAQGQSFTARGEGTIAKRRVEGSATVDLVGGLVGVPLRVSGPLAAPNVSVPTSAIATAAAGAAVGTAVLPGVGTALGAKLGELFGRPR
jgi:uncharacterized protein involved in outer membrane biogenesis